MIGRLFGLVASGLCVLSLLACVGTGWAWWRSGAVFRRSAAAAANGTFVWGWADRDGVSVWVVDRWPGPDGAWAEAPAAAADAVGWELSPVRVDWTRAVAGADFVAGGYGVGVGPDGRAVRMGPRTGRPPGTRTSGPVPARAAIDVPYGAVLAAFAVPPLLWLGAYGRRAMVRRRRRRLGLCRRCGYDLRGTPSGVCPECGTAAVLARQSRGAQ